MTLASLVEERRIVICTGTGGVGKTTTAAAVAIEAARRGRRAVVVTIDPAKRLADALGLGALGNEPALIAGDWPGELYALQLDTKSTFDGLVARYAPSEEQAERILANRFYRNLSGALSGTQEYMAGEKLYELHDGADFDLVVVDAAATGHIVAQLGAADAIRELVDVGPLRSQTQWVSDILADPAITAVNVVTTPEEMPVVETIELVERIRTDVHVPLGTVIVNRVLPELFTRADDETFEALRAPERTALLTQRIGRGATDVLDAARLAVSLRRTGATHLEQLRQAVDLPLLYVPYLFVRAHGLRVTRMVADALGAELGL